MPRFSKDPRTFPEVCHTLLHSIRNNPLPNYTFAFPTGREADQFKALLTAYRNAFVHYAQALRTQRKYSDSSHAEEAYVLLGSYGIHLHPPKHTVPKPLWPHTPIQVRVTSKSALPVYASAMQQLAQQLDAIPNETTPQKLLEMEQLEPTDAAIFASAPLLDLTTIEPPPDPYATFRPPADPKDD